MKPDPVVASTGRRSGILTALLAAGIVGFGSARTAQSPSPAVDPLVAASPYDDKTVWSYHGGKEPLPWSRFRPKDYGSAAVAFSGDGVRPVGRVPAPGVHPRILFSPEDLPGIRQRIRQDPAAIAAWRNILAFANAMKLTWDPQADYARRPGQPSTQVNLGMIGGIKPQREDYYGIYARGGTPAKAPDIILSACATEALRCLIEEDAAGARTLARVVVNIVTQEQARREHAPPTVQPGQPPRWDGAMSSRLNAVGLGYVYDFIHGWLTPEERTLLHDELVVRSAWADNYGTFNNAEASRSNWATFSYWAFDLMAIEGEPGFNDLKFLGLYRGWRNYLTYSFYDSGATCEGEGKLLFGIDAVVAFDRVGWKYGLEPLSHHPLLKSHYRRFTALSALPTSEAEPGPATWGKGAFAAFDMLGGMGRNLTTPQDVVVAHYLYPGDRALDVVYRKVVGEYFAGMPSQIWHNGNHAIPAAIFATAFDPADTPQALDLPLTFFCGQRSLMMTRSSWDPQATFLTMHVRGASGGHPYRDRNGIMLSALGRAWATIPNYDSLGPGALDTVTIDGAGQEPTTPGRTVDQVDAPLATFMVGDAAYCWDWTWDRTARNRRGGDLTVPAVEQGQADIGPGWMLEEHCFNDFAFTRNPAGRFQEPFKFSRHWLAPDGVVDAVVRTVNRPVLKAFRTAGLVRGPRPYVLVVDDIQRSPLPADYAWNLTLPLDVVLASSGEDSDGQGDLILAGKASLGADRRVRPGEPALLIRFLQAEGRRMVALAENVTGVKAAQNLLSVRTRAVAPEFKVLIQAFTMGQPLPVTGWDGTHTVVTVELPGQQDAIAFTAAPSGKTDLVITRGGQRIVAVERPIVPLSDPQTDALLGHLRGQPARLEALRREGYDPRRLPDFLGGWSFDRIQDGCFPPLPGSDPRMAPIPVGTSTVVEGVQGGKAVSIGKDPLHAILPGPEVMGRSPFTIACWIKLRNNEGTGNIFAIKGLCTMFLAQGRWLFGTGRLPTAMLLGWTHVVFTGDTQTQSLYRDGILVATRPTGDRPLEWRKEMLLGSDNPAWVVEFAMNNLTFFKTAMPADAVERLYLWERYLPGSPP